LLKSKQEDKNMSKQNKLVYLETARILPHPKNPRKELGNLTEMAESVKANGIMQNLTVVEVGNLPAERIAELGVTAEQIDGGYYMVVIGHRRLGAAKLAGLSEVPCVISDMSYEDQLATMVTENLQRTDLTPVEQAQGLRQLSMELGLGAAQIAEKTGISETTVRRRLKVAAIPADQLEKAAKGKQISIGDLEKVGEINDEELRDKALGAIGTANFEWQVKNAKDIEKKREQESAWTEVMESMGLRRLEHKERYSGEWKPIVSVSKSAKPSNEKFLGAKLDGTVKPEWEVAYWLEEYPSEVRLFAKTGADAVNVDPAKAAWDAEWNERKRTVDNLKQAFEELSEKRKFWVGGLDSATCTAVFGAFMVGAVDYWAYNNGNPYTGQDVLEEFLGDWTNEEGKTDGGLLNSVKNDARRHPVQTALWAIYAGIEQNGGDHYTFETWQYGGDKTAKQYMGDYRADDKLDLIYKLLEAIGYEVEPYERALLDGTSAMYYVNGGAELAEVKAEKTCKDDATAEPGKEMTRFEALKLLSEEQLAKWVAAFDRGRNPGRAAELLNLIPACETVEELTLKLHDWFCCDIPCAVDENGDDIPCAVCIDRWFNEKKRWGFHTLMKEAQA
jgi:ParB family chromosome partitioning protein